MSLQGKSLHVLTPMYGGNLTLNYHNSFLRLVLKCRELGVNLDWTNTWNESLVSRARNRLTDSYMKTNEHTHAIFIDADIGFEPDDVFSMMEMDKDILGVPCSKKSIRWDRIQNAIAKRVLEWAHDSAATKNGNDPAALVDMFNKSGRAFQPDLLPRMGGDFVLNFAPFEGMKTIQLNEPEPMKHVGTGMLMVKREVFQKFKKCYPDRWYEAKSDTASNPGPIHDFFKVGVNPETREYDSEDYWFCLPPKSRVYGDMLPIEKYGTANRVMSHKGKLRPVLNRIERDYRGKMVSVLPHHGAGFRITPSHSVFVFRDRKLQFVPAGELKTTDKLTVPIQSELTRRATLKAPIRNKFVEKKDGRFRYTRTRKANQWFPMNVPVNDDLCSLLGYWIAEGSRANGLVDFNLNKSEHGYAVEIQDLLHRCFGLQSTLHIRKQTLTVTCYSVALEDFLVRHCGRIARFKKVPEAILRGKLNWIKSCLHSYWKGDGEKSFPYGLRTVSAGLIHDLRYMMLRCGIYPGLYESPCNRAGRIAYTLRATQSFYREWSDVIGVRDYMLQNRNGGKKPMVERKGKYFLVGIKRLRTRSYNGKVFNLKVKADETYNVNGFAVHNCHDCIAIGYKVLLLPSVVTTHMGTYTFVGDMPAALALTGTIF